MELSPPLSQMLHLFGWLCGIWRPAPEVVMCYKFRCIYEDENGFCTLDDDDPILCIDPDTGDFFWDADHGGCVIDPLGTTGLKCCRHWELISCEGQCRRFGYCVET